MHKHAVKKIEEQVSAAAEPEKKPGLWRRAYNWVKGLFKKGAKAVGKLVPDRVKTFVISLARKVSKALSYAYDYVAQPLSWLLNYYTLGFALGLLIPLALIAPFVVPLLVLAVIGGGVLLLIGYAYLHSKEETSPLARRIVRLLDQSAAYAWLAMKAAAVAATLVFNGAAAIVVIGLIFAVNVVLVNDVVGTNKALNRRRAIAEADAILADPSMPAVATA